MECELRIHSYKDSCTLVTIRKQNAQCHIYSIQYGIINDDRIHAIFDQSITNPLADKDGYHDGNDVSKTTSQLKHYHYKRHWRERGGGREEERERERRERDHWL